MPRGRISRQNRASRDSQRTIHAENLFDEVRNETVHLSALVADWLRLYRSNEGAALTHLLNFMLQSCGLKKAGLTQQELEDRDMEDLLDTIHQEAKESEDYPLITKQKGFKNFYLNFQFFWVHLIAETVDEIYDGVFLNFTINWLTNLSFSKYRPIRHTSCAAVLSMSQSLIDILNKEMNDLDRVQTFIQTEMRAGTSPRLDNLKEQEKVLKNKIKTITDVLQSVFREVIMHRFRDVMLEIRALSVQAVSNWADKYPSGFLNVHTLRILELMLFDKSSEVREHVIDSLHKLYSKSINLEILQEFSIKNSLRILEMSHDIEHKVCVKAIKLCTIFAKNGVFDKFQVDMISCLLWAENDDIRNAAADFVNIAVFKDELPVQVNDTSGFGIEQGRSLDAEKAITIMVEFFKEFGDKQFYRVELMVKAFWSKTSAIRSWEVLTDLLRRGDMTRKNTTQLEEVDRLIVAHIILSALKYQKSNQSERKNKNSLIHLSSCLIQNLGGLLTYYRHDIPMLNELLNIIPYLDVTALASKDLNENFNEMLRCLQEILYQHSDKDILLKTGYSIGYLSREHHHLQKEAKEILAQSSFDIVKEFKKVIKKHMLSGAEESELEVKLTRTMSLLAIEDILEDLGEDRISDITRLFNSFLIKNIQSETIGMRLAEMIYYIFLWSLNRVTKDLSYTDKFLSLRNNVIDLLTTCAAKEDLGYEMKKLTFKLLCECIMVISGQSAHNSPIYWEVSPEVWRTVEDYMLGLSIIPEVPPHLYPPKAFYKRGAKGDAIREDGNVDSQMVCFIVGRLITSCPSITISQLPSSYFANYGYLNLRSIALIVKQVMTNFKLKDLQQTGPFKESNLYFSIMRDSLIKCFGNKEHDDLIKMKELAKKFCFLIGAGPMRPKQADRFKEFLLEGMGFAFLDAENFPLLDALTIFVTRNYLSPIQHRELYERLNRDMEKLEEKIKEVYPNWQEKLVPVKSFLYALGKNAGVNISRPSNVSSRGRKSMNKRVVTKEIESEESEVDSELERLVSEFAEGFDKKDDLERVKENRNLDVVIKEEDYEEMSDEERKEDSKEDRASKYSVSKNTRKNSKRRELEISQRKYGENYQESEAEEEEDKVQQSESESEKSENEEDIQQPVKKKGKKVDTRSNSSSSSEARLQINSRKKPTKKASGKSKSPDPAPDKVSNPSSSTKPSKKSSKKQQKASSPVPDSKKASKKPKKRSKYSEKSKADLLNLLKSDESEGNASASDSEIGSNPHKPPEKRPRRKTKRTEVTDEESGVSDEGRSRKAVKRFKSRR